MVLRRPHRAWSSSGSGRNQDNLRRIDVWAFAGGGAAGEAAEIFARLTPAGSDRPIRESRAEVHGARFSNATVAFNFEPILR